MRFAPGQQIRLRSGKSDRPTAGSRAQTRPPEPISCIGRACSSSTGITRLGKRAGYGHVLDVGPIEDRLHAERIAHAGHIRGDRAVAERDQNPRVRADFPDFHQVVLAGNGAFDERDVDLFRKILAVDERAVNQVGLRREIQQPLVDIEETTCGSRSSRPARRWRAWGLLIFASHERQVRKELALFGHLGDRMALFAERAGGTELHAFAATGAALRFAPGLREIGDHHAVGAAPGHVPGMRAFDFVADPDAARAQNATVLIHDEARMAGVDRKRRINVGITDVVDAQLLRQD
jgi:hypothetical protein